MKFSSQITPAIGFAPQSVAASADETGVDCSGYDEIIYSLMVGAVDTLTSFDVCIEECATVDGTYTEISGAAFTQITTADHELHLSVPVNIAKPFQRVAHVLVGTAVLASVSMLLCKPAHLPATAGS